MSTSIRAALACWRSSRVGIVGCSPGAARPGAARALPARTPAPRATSTAQQQGALAHDPRADQKRTHRQSTAAITAGSPTRSQPVGHGHRRTRPIASRETGFHLLDRQVGELAVGEGKLPGDAVAIGPVIDRDREQHVTVPELGPPRRLIRPLLTVHAVEVRHIDHEQLGAVGIPQPVKRLAHPRAVAGERADPVGHRIVPPQRLLRPSRPPTGPQLHRCDGGDDQ